jgi:hypothetical protein
LENNVMVSAKERRRLMEDFEREPLGSIATRGKCVVCIIFIVGIAAMGYRTESATREADGLRAQRLSNVVAGQHADYAQNTTQEEHGP